MKITHGGEKLKVIRWNEEAVDMGGGEVVVEIPEGQRYGSYSRYSIPFSRLKKVQVTCIKKWPAWCNITLD